MRRRLRLLALASAAVPALAAPLAAQQSHPFSGDVVTLSERVRPGAWLRIYDPNGRIEVTEGSGSAVEIRAERRRGDEDVELQVIRSGDDVTVCAVLEDGRCDEEGYHGRSRRRDSRDGESTRINFQVRVPRGVLIRVATGNGEVSVTGAGAEVQAASGNGRVRVVTSSGAVRASSGNGEVTVEGATDRVEASSGNGRVSVATRKGPVSASSGNGDIDVRMDTLGDDDDMHFSTGNGRIQVTVPSSFTGDIESTLGHGEFRSDFPLTLKGRLSPTHVRATIGTGGPRVRMSSGNGDIELLKRG